MYIGLGSAIGVGEETTYGTAVSRTGWYRPLSASIARTISRRPRGVLSEATGSHNRRRHYTAEDQAGGPFEIPVCYDSQGLLWKHALWGTPATTGPSGGLYTHTFTLGTSKPTGGLTIEQILGTGAAEVFEGGRVATAEWKVSAGGIWTCTPEVIAETSGGLASAGTPSYATNEYDVEHHQLSAATWNSINLASIGLISASVKLDNKLARRQRLGSSVTKDPARSDYVEVTARIELDYTASGMHAGFLADTESDLVLTSTRTADSRSFTIKVNNAYIEDLKLPADGAGPLKYVIQFRGQSNGTTEGLELVVVNTQGTATAF